MWSKFSYTTLLTFFHFVIASISVSLIGSGISLYKSTIITEPFTPKCDQSTIKNCWKSTPFISNIYSYRYPGMCIGHNFRDCIELECHRNYTKNNYYDMYIDTILDGSFICNAEGHPFVFDQMTQNASYALMILGSLLTISQFICCMCSCCKKKEADRIVIINGVDQETVDMKELEIVQIQKNH